MEIVLTLKGELYEIYFLPKIFMRHLKLTIRIEVLEGQLKIPINALHNVSYRL